MYTGLWQHWFVRREPSFVRVYVRANREVLEVARTGEKFLAYATIIAIVSNDGVDESVRAFAERAGVRDVEALDKLTLATGDDPPGFVAAPAFQRATPLSSVGDPACYDGGFPTAADPVSSPRWAVASAFELAEQLPDAEGVKARLLARGGPHEFRRAAERGDLHAAWLALNSPGWALDAARDAVRDLATAASDHEFTRMSEAWLAASDGQVGGW